MQLGVQREGGRWDGSFDMTHQRHSQARAPGARQHRHPGDFREAAFVALVKLLGIATPKHHVAWRSPLKETKAGALKVLLWQSDDATRGDKKGPVLVCGAELPDKSWVLGAGFVPADDNTESDKAILAATESLAPSPPTPPRPTPAAP